MPKVSCNSSIYSLRGKAWQTSSRQLPHYMWRSFFRGVSKSIVTGHCKWSALRRTRKESFTGYRTQPGDLGIPRSHVPERSSNGLWSVCRIMRNRQHHVRIIEAQWLTASPVWEACNRGLNNHQFHRISKVVLSLGFRKGA